MYRCYTYKLYITVSTNKITYLQVQIILRAQTTSIIAAHRHYTSVLTPISAATRASLAVRCETDFTTAVTADVRDTTFNSVWRLMSIISSVICTY